MSIGDNGELVITNNTFHFVMCTKTKSEPQSSKTYS